MVFGDSSLKKLLLLLLVPVVALIVWAILRKGDPPEVPFTTVKRGTLVSTLSTNGKVEPLEWQSVRAEAAGVVERVAVQEGQTVTAGATLAILGDPEVKAAGDAAAVRAAEAQAALATIDAGGKASELAEIDNNLARAKFDRDEAQRELASLKRLQEKRAATPVDVASAAAKVRQPEMEIEGFEKRRAALVSKADRSVALARLRDAQAAVSLAKERLSQMLVRTPIGGVVYQLAVRRGAYLSIGDAVADVGRLDRLRVRVYVDEPELGRVAEHQPVTITWDALPAKQWTGTVEKKPTSIQTLGTRQVGEVICTIDNPGKELISGTNINAAIRTAVVPDAISVPKEVLRRDGQGAFVYVLRGGTVERRAIETGISSITRVQVTAGLAAGDAVAMPTDVIVKPGLHLTPIVQ
jgi:HlyD family secretion protein